MRNLALAKGEGDKEAQIMQVLLQNGCSDVKQCGKILSRTLAKICSKRKDKKKKHLFSFVSSNDIPLDFYPRNPFIM